MDLFKLVDQSLLSFPCLRTPTNRFDWKEGEERAQWFDCWDPNRPASAENGTIESRVTRFIGMGGIA